jgi:hypothetical protein
MRRSSVCLKLLGDLQKMQARVTKMRLPATRGWQIMLANLERAERWMT